MMKTIRVGFVLFAGDWIGGRNYLRNLFSAIGTLPGKPIVPVLVAGKQTAKVEADFPGVETLKTSLLDSKGPAWFARQMISKLAGRDVLLAQFLRRHGITVLSHSVSIGRQTEITTIGWIPDFQHVYLPELFTSAELRDRNRKFRQLCESSHGVFISSECARSDLAEMFPNYLHKTHLLRFVASPLPLGRAATLSELRAAYQFRHPYFLVPNQFWAHKNHRVIIDALRILKAQGRPVLVLATGSTSDYRNPLFFDSLMRHIDECDVAEFFHVLGQVPFDHLVGLMRYAIAFINPSRSEGWSTSVEEAKSMGKQILLSDLAVHREQAPPRGIFFAPDDPNALAREMLSAWDGYDAARDEEFQNHARSSFPARQEAFGEAYWQAICEAVSNQGRNETSKT